MAQYHVRAEKLKPLIAKAGFSAEQLTIVHSMMRGCTMLRQGKVISEFLRCMLPEDMEMKLGAERQGAYGSYRPIYVVKKGTELIETDLGEDDQ